jgi:hypothetical protein
MEIVQNKNLEELWEELNAHLQKGIPDLTTLQRVYNALTKFMSVCMVSINYVSERLDLETDAEEYNRDVRGMIIKNMHYNERRLLRHLRLPEEMKEKVTYRDGLTQRFEQCKDIQRVLRDRLEVFKLEYQLSGGNYQ